MRKPVFCICESKDVDQLRGNREADQRLCFCYTDSTIPLLLKSEISRVLVSSVAVRPSLCWTWSETPKTGFSHNEAHLIEVLHAEMEDFNPMQLSQSFQVPESIRKQSTYRGCKVVGI